MTGYKRSLCAGIAASALFACGAASAQQVQVQSVAGDLNAAAAQSKFRRDRNVSVAQRPHPGYEALGIRQGAFMIWPKVTVSGEYNSNIFATSDNAVADGIFHITPEVNVTSDWSRHALSAYARGVINEFAQNSDQNTNDYAVGATGQLDILRTAQVNGGLDFSRLTEPRTSAGSEGQRFPVQYRTTTAFVAGAREFNRLRLSGRVNWQKFDYLNREGNSAQDDRDRTVTTFSGRADYAVSPDTALFVEVAGNKRNYRLSSSPTVGGTPEFPAFQNRDSSGIEALAGANFELAALVRGELGVGYLRQNFKDDAFKDVSGLGVRGQVEWFPTQLTTVTLNAARTVEDAAIQGASSFVSNNVGLKVDHELLRNVILGANATYGKDDYKGLDRSDKHYSAGVSASYLMNRSVGLTLAYNHTHQDSSGSDSSARLANYTVDRVGLTLTLQY